MYCEYDGHDVGYDDDDKDDVDDEEGNDGGGDDDGDDGGDDDDGDAGDWKVQEHWQKAIYERSRHRWVR